jgi:hypothetical protein
MGVPVLIRAANCDRAKRGRYLKGGIARICRGDLTRQWSLLLFHIFCSAAYISRDGAGKLPSFSERRSASFG